MPTRFQTLMEHWFYRALVSVALFMIAIGQFNDTKDVLSAIYDNISTHFTHSVQYEALEHVTVGRTVAYVEGVLGPTEVIKPSKKVDDVRFLYYNLKKAVLVVIAKEERVSGFVVIPVVSDFTPDLPFTKKPFEVSTFTQLNASSEDFYFDIANLAYYAEVIDMGKEYLFLRKVVGFIEYGKLGEGSGIQASKETITNLGALDAMMQRNDDDTDKTITQFRRNVAPNFYGYTELEPQIVIESLLTRFEFKTYFGASL